MTDLAKKYLSVGGPVEIRHEKYKKYIGRLVDVQPITDGSVCGIYRFPGGDCIGGPILKISNEVINVETKTENQWDTIKTLCLDQALKSIETEGNHIPNIACVEVAEHLTNIAIAIEKHQIQSEGLDHIKKIREFCNSITDEMEE